MLARTLERIAQRKNATHDNAIHNNAIHNNATYHNEKNNSDNNKQDKIDNKQQGTEQQKSHNKLSAEICDELWIVEHNEVYTLGQAGKEEHILGKSDTPIIKTDRGGQVTWHGKGQLVLYWLFDLTALNWKVRDLVSHAEQAIEDVVNYYLPDHLIAKARADAPGVYVFHKQQGQKQMLGKIASLGFKIKQGFSYHGIALNLNCDLTAFNLINPCGYAGMQMLRLADFADIDSVSESASNSSTIASIEDSPVTQILIDNISQRHLGKIKLR